MSTTITAVVIIGLMLTCVLLAAAITGMVMVTVWDRRPIKPAAPTPEREARLAATVNDLRAQVERLRATARLQRVDPTAPQTGADETQIITRPPRVPQPPPPATWGTPEPTNPQTTPLLHHRTTPAPNTQGRHR